jgi:hypothetical protein
MGSILRKLFNLYPGEEKNAIIFSILAFIWACGAYCGVTLSDGMFLEHVGADQLPLAYLLTALSLFFISVLFIYAFNHFDAFKLYFATLTFGITGFIITLVNLPDENSHGNLSFWLFFKVFCNILMVILTTSYWFFLDQYFNLQNAKRLYSLFNSSIFLGNATGGAFLAISLNSIGLRGISMGIILLFMLAGLWLLWLNTKVKPFLDDTIEGLATPEKIAFKEMIKGFLKSRFTILLMVFYFLIQLINVVCEFTYMQSFDQYFDSNRQEGIEDNSLTIFLGTCTSIIALVNMVFGWFFYSRMVGRFGINNIIGISPLFFLATFASWQFTDILMIAIIGLIVVEGVSYTIDENNSNLLLNTVPSKLKNKARVAIDSFFEPLGMLLSALIFMFLSIPSKKLGLFLTAFSLIFVFLIRNEYGKAILKNLLQNAIHFERKAKNWFLSINKKEMTIAKNQLVKTFKGGDETLKIFAFETLLILEDQKLLRRLLAGASSLSIKSKLKIIHLLSSSTYAKESFVLQWLSTQLQKTPFNSLKGPIFYYFAKLGLLSFEKVKNDIESNDLYLKSAYILTFYKKDEYEALKLIEKLLHSSVIEEICMGLNILAYIKESRYQDLIIPFLSHTNQKIIFNASLALSKITTKESMQYAKDIIALFHKTSDSIIRIHCLKCIENMQEPHLAKELLLTKTILKPSEKRSLEETILNLGPKTIPLLLDITKDKSLPAFSRLLAGKTLALLSIEILREHLYEIVTSEIEKAYFYFYYSYNLPIISKEPQLSLLQQTLFSDYQSSIDFIIQLLASSGSIENGELLSHGLKSKNPKLRATAIETLEKTCSSKIFRILKPLIDDRPIEEKLKIYKKRKHAALTYDELIEMLQNTSTQTNLLIAHALKGELI